MNTRVGIITALLLLSACVKSADKGAEAAYSRSEVARIIEAAPADSLCELLAPLLAVADSAELSLLADAEWSRLADPNSPWRDEPRHIAFLRAMLASARLSAADSLRYEDEIALRSLNQPGTMAASFDFATLDGSRHTLHDFAPGKQLLLVFYDPECPPCHESIEMLAANQRLNSRVADGTLAILAVYAEGDDELWRRTAPSMPANWTAAIDLDSIVDRSIYHIPAMPTIYLLTSSRMVVLKDAPMALL